MKSIAKKNEELRRAKAEMMGAGESDAKKTMRSIRMGLLVGWLVCLAGAFVMPPLGYVFGVLIVLWIVVGFAGLFVK